MRHTLVLSLLLLLGCPKEQEPDDTSPPEDTVPQVTDVDEDGYPEGEDCDDRDAAINPGAEEICDGLDNDCDDEVDEGVLTVFYPDEDQDGFGDVEAGEEHCEAPDGWVEDATDCDDSRDDVYPGAEEPCDGADNDCDDEVDEEGDSTWYQDADGDGFGEAELSQLACSPGEGWVSDATDCDDSRDDVHPEADEVCDEVDNDCDGAIDEDVTTTYYADTDGDGYGVDDDRVEACEAPEGYVELGGDCDDADASVNPAATEVCNEIDDDCDGDVDEDVTTTYYADADGDGYGSDADLLQACEQPEGHVEKPGDCDDADASAYPGGTEICDGVDNDCDGTVDGKDASDASTWYLDADGDGFGLDGSTQRACTQPSGHASLAGDCDDGDAAVNPAGTEICSGADEDCDGLVDDADDSLDSSTASSWYLDADGDGYGDDRAVALACDQPSGTVDASMGGDCDDADAAVHPAASEICDGVDNDCDGLTDAEDDSVSGTASWYADADGDGYGDATVSTSACDQPTGYVADSSDCDDTLATISPVADEVCDGLDNDCDGMVDDADSDVIDGETWYLDADGDGYGLDTSSATACDQPTGYVEQGEDCDDGDPAISPDAGEICDEVDNDCDGSVDESATDQTVWYADLDGDGYGDLADTTWACDQPSDFVADSSDCDDGNPDAYPGASGEVCSGADLDCDGVVPDLCASCAEHLDAEPAAVDGLYVVDLDGSGDEWEVWCDMSTDGGGWTLFQRTVWDWEETELLWTGYSDWYGVTLGDPDQGLAYRLAGELWPYLNADLEFMVVHTPRDGGDGSDCDPLYYLGDSGSLAVSSKGTTLTGLVDTVDLTSGTELATSDSGTYSGCVTSYYAVPWFYGSCCFTCPTYGGAAWSSDPRPTAKYLDTDADFYGNTSTTVCDSGDAEKSYGGAGVFEGVNAMEFYMR